MKPVYRSSRYLVVVLLTGTLLRAFVPAGYMPAAPGTGLLFELCHDGVPPAIMAALGGHSAGHDSHAHGHHGQHDAEDAAGAGSPCSIGHILSLAVIDAVESIEAAVVRPADFAAVDVPALRFAARTRAFSARAPPLV